MRGRSEPVITSPCHGETSGFDSRRPRQSKHSPPKERTLARRAVRRSAEGGRKDSLIPVGTAEIVL